MKKKAGEESISHLYEAGVLTLTQLIVVIVYK
jgi:hypothetical protein